MSNFVHKNVKRQLYFEEVIRLYYEKDFGYKRIARLIPISKSTILKWVHEYASNHSDLSVKMKRLELSKRDSSLTRNSACTSAPSTAFREESSPTSELEGDTQNLQSLRDEVARLQKALAHECLRADAYEEMINIAERQLKVSIRKKSGAKQ